MSYALLFAGQGTQHAGMLPWLEQAAPAQPLLAQLLNTLGCNWRGALDGPHRARNDVAQPLIVGTALAAWAALRALLEQGPEIVAGYSVGELAALGAAGSVAPGEAIVLACRRAALMDAAAAGCETGLLSIGGVPAAQVLAEHPALECAIRIGPEQNVFGGTRAALQAARAALQDRARLKDIDVALASHTRWMRSAADGLVPVLQAARLQPPGCAIALNATGAATRSPPVLARALAAQVARTVEWEGCMAAVAQRRPSCVLEIGAGQALARSWAAQHPDIPVRSIDDFRSPAGAAAWLARQR